MSPDLQIAVMIPFDQLTGKYPDFRMVLKRMDDEDATDVMNTT